jgi:drug/metabolite transporter (DMT)-like permease
MVSWVVIALLAGLGAATSDALLKKFFSGLTPYGMGLARLLYALPWMALIFAFMPWPETNLVFWVCVGSALPLELAAFLIYMKALKVAPLSLSIPFLAFTPVFVILTGWIVLGEKISVWGSAGIVLIVAGSYVLNLSKMAAGWASPLKAAFEEPGSRYMLLVSFIFALTSTIGKLAVVNSEPVFFGMLYSILLTAAMALLRPFLDTGPGGLPARPVAGFVLGLVVALTVIFHMVAISRIEAAYMIAIKRTSLLFSVLYGAFWFREEAIRERFAGAALMLAGIFLIGFSA